MFTQAFPIYRTPNLERALGFYRDLLDGEVTYQFPPDGAPAFVSLTIGSSIVGIGEDAAAGDVPALGRVSLWVYVDDCDVAVERLRAAGVTITEEPTVQPWGETVAHVQDPDGNPVIIGQAAS